MRGVLSSVLAVILALQAPELARGQGAGFPRFGVATPMRDGVRLVSNIWLPDTVGRFPTILIRTPYDKTPQFKRYSLAAYVNAGYAVVLQDTRGRGDSDGEFGYFFVEGKDGYDTIEWIARQPWSNGRVATDGGSYLGTVQYLAAREQPPHLACIAPFVPLGRHFDEAPYVGGAFALQWALTWIPWVSGRLAQVELNELVAFDELVKHRPLARLDTLLGRPMKLYQDMLAHATLDDYWKRIQFGPADFEKIQIPVLTVTGWFDGDQAGTLFYWDGMERRSDPRNPHWLIVGPWNHVQTYLGGATKIGELTMDSSSVLASQRIRIDFFDWCLKQSKPSFDSPKVRVFVMGANRWRTGDRYPLPEAEPVPLYLSSGGRANTLNGDGSLSWTAPVSGPQDRFTYDPRNPVPSKPFAIDHREIEGREDVLVYTTPALTEALEVVGRVFVKLHAATDGKDTDFVAKLLDVFPDGRAIKLGATPAGVRRARYRYGYEREVFVTSEAPTEYSIELGEFGYQFEPGHRIRLEISSSAAPFISPNQNTGNPVATDTVWRTASQTVYHDATHPSRVILPVIKTKR